MGAVLPSGLARHFVRHPHVFAYTSPDAPSFLISSVFEALLADRVPLGGSLVRGWRGETLSQSRLRWGTGAATPGCAPKGGVHCIGCDFVSYAAAKNAFCQSNSQQIGPGNPNFSAKIASIVHLCPTLRRAFCPSILCFHTHFRIDLHFLYF